MRYILLSVIAIGLLLAVVNRATAEETIVWGECVKEAKKNHPDLISAREQLNQTKAEKEITRSAVMPQVSAAFSETTSKAASQSSSSSSSSSSSGSSRKDYTTTYQYSISGQQLLFDGFKTSYDLSAAERTIRASKYNYEVTSSDIRLRLRTAFIDLLSAQELLKVTEEIASRRKQNVDLVTLRYESGREHKGSLLTSEADLAQAQFEVEQAKRSIWLSQRRLVKELGRSKLVIPLVASGDLGIKRQYREKPDFEYLAETAPLLKELIARKEAAKFGERSAIAELYPQVYATGSVGRSDTVWLPKRKTWLVGTSVSLPIFEGGSTFANISKTRALLKQAQADETSGRDGVILTLANAWTDLQDAVDSVEIQKKFLEATKERSRISEAEYSVGLLSFDNWVIIEDNFVKAKKDLLSAEMNALLAEATWIQAQGGTLDYDEE